jgi:hypothetical protein
MSQQNESALVRELRAAGHDRAADKHAALDALYAKIGPDADGHRPLTDDELAVQAANALSVEEMQAVQRVEYGTWVATADIPHGNATAYGAGHPVPVSAVERFGYDQIGLVKRGAGPSTPDRDTPAAEAPKAKTASAAKAVDK